jgi:Domain of unknown function (DUF4399)
MTRRVLRLTIQTESISMLARATALLLLGPLMTKTSFAIEAMPTAPLERECWLSHTRARTRVNLREPLAVDFGNLRDGAAVVSPFRVDFSVRGMGVSPAGTAHPKAGHHHILVNQGLPQRVGDQIPFNDHHRHFGKGQTSTVLTLPVGEHRLRLLFADHEHRPYFVYSPEIRVRVIQKSATDAKPVIFPSHFAEGCALWYDHEVSRPRAANAKLLTVNVRDGESVRSPVNLRFGVDGFGVAPRAKALPGFGWFRLEARPERGGVPERIDLDKGATQANMFLSNGAWQLRLHFLDSEGKALLPAVE